MTCGAIWGKMILRATGASGNCRIVLQFHGKDVFATVCLSLAAVEITLWANELAEMAAGGWRRKGGFMGGKS